MSRGAKIGTVVVALWVLGWLIALGVQAKHDDRAPDCYTTSYPRTVLTKGPDGVLEQSPAPDGSIIDTSTFCSP